MLMAKDGEIENHDGTRGIDLLFFWCFGRMRLLAMLAQLNACSPVGNESTRLNDVTLSACALRIHLGVSVLWGNVRLCL